MYFIIQVVICFEVNPHVMFVNILDILQTYFLNELYPLEGKELFGVQKGTEKEILSSQEVQKKEKDIAKDVKVFHKEEKPFGTKDVKLEHFYHV